MNIEKIYYEKTAQTVISALKKRNMDGYYVSSKEEACEQILSFLHPNSSISWGGSMTLSEIGIFSILEKQPSFTLLDRSKVPPEQVEDIYRQAFSCDTYLMSSNAITIDGKLINIDGNGNRVAALIYGPKQVIIVAGMNKIVANEQAGLDRLATIAAPMNTIRLNQNTPCSHTGHCHQCLSEDCICMHTVITRNSRHKGRIKVILIGESLGY